MYLNLQQRVEPFAVWVIFSGLSQDAAVSTLIMQAEKKGIRVLREARLSCDVYVLTRFKDMSESPSC